MTPILNKIFMLHVDKFLKSIFNMFCTSVSHFMIIICNICMLYRNYMHISGKHCVVHSQTLCCAQPNTVLCMAKHCVVYSQTLCCVQPTASRKLQWRAKESAQIVTLFVQCTFHISKMPNVKLRVVFLHPCLEYWWSDYWDTRAG